MDEVPATEFTRNFGRTGSSPSASRFAVTIYRPTTGYFVAAVEFEELQRLKAFARRSRAVANLTKAEVEETAATSVAPEHDHLNVLLDKE